MLKRVISILSDMLVAVVLLFSVAFSISSIKSGYTNFCGYSIVQVLSSSMEDSGIKRGDVKLIHSADDYHIGDIVAFYYQSGDEQVILYHEIIEETEDGGFITKGSSNSLPEAQTTYSSSIIGRQVNDGNYQLLVFVPFRIGMVLVAYAISMGYIVYIIIDIIKDEKRIKFNLNREQKKKATSNNSSKKIKIIKCSRKHISRVIIGLLALSCCGLISGRAFAVGQPYIIAAQTVVFNAETILWTDAEKLTEEAYESATDFEYAINNPSTPEGQAWTQAWSSKNTLGNSYVGSMDKNAGDELEIVFDYEDANYIIKRKNNNEYYLYVTYEKLDRAYGTVQPVYKTYYKRDNNGNLVPMQSWVGKCNRAIYSIYQLTTYAFDTESFVEI